MCIKYVIEQVLHGVPKEVDDLVHPLAVDLDALAVAAEPVVAAQTAATVTASAPHKAPGDFAAAAAAHFVPHCGSMFIHVPRHAALQAKEKALAVYFKTWTTASLSNAVCCFSLNIITIFLNELTFCHRSSVDDSLPL